MLCAYRPLLDRFSLSTPESTHHMVSPSSSSEGLHRVHGKHNENKYMQTTRRQCLWKKGTQKAVDKHSSFLSQFSEEKKKKWCMKDAWYIWITRIPLSSLLSPDLVSLWSVVFPDQPLHHVNDPAEIGWSPCSTLYRGDSRSTLTCARCCFSPQDIKIPMTTF